ncbi:MAG: transposase [Arsenophonus sp. NEOnobi-MAG3]
MLQLAPKNGIKISIFCALYTYGQQLNQHTHVHVFVTSNGLNIKHAIIY